MEKNKTISNGDWVRLVYTTQGMKQIIQGFIEHQTEDAIIIKSRKHKHDHELIKVERKRILKIDDHVKAGVFK